MVGVYTDTRYYSLESATNTATGSAVDMRSRGHIYTYVNVVGGSAITTLEASHSIGADSAWLPVETITAAAGSTTTAIYDLWWPYLRGHSSGYDGATA